MAFLNSMLSFLFGENTRKTIEIFRENREAAAERDEARINAALNQFSMEFQQANRSGFDRLIDGINRLPRPMMAFCVICLFYAAMADPDWFIARMQGLGFVPEPLWWLLGAVVSFYFGARHHAKSTEFQSNMARYAAQSGARETAPDVQTSRNAAIADWQNDRS
jgi:hypothetical protein